MKLRSSRVRYGVILLAVVLAIALALAAGCAKKGPESQPTAAKPSQQQETKTEAQPAAAGQQLANVSCAECHEMWPEVATWQISSHSKISCETCHSVDVGEMKRAKEGGAYSKPIRLKQPVSDAVCDGCHSPYRVATPSGDLIIPHDRHAKAGVGCLKCHQTVVHAGIAERAVTARPDYADYAKWTPETARKVATLPFVRPSMWTCLNCHKSLKVTSKCAACHTVYTSLPSHEDPAWATSHGRVGRQNVSGCSKCHANREGPTMVDSKTGDKIIDFERATPFCYNCHRQRPASHDAQWMPKHPSAAQAKGLLNCFACHSVKQPAAGENVTGTYCNSCHWFEAGSKPSQPQEEGKKKEG